MGDNLRTRRAYLAELEARAARLEREREEQATPCHARGARPDRARAPRCDRAQRQRDGRAGVGRRGCIRFGSWASSEALAAVASTGRDALNELRRLLGVIRPGEDEEPSFAPQPGVGRLDELIEQVRDTGLAVDLSVDGKVRELPEATSLCVYRIIQEALTNTLKHAAATRAQVNLRYGADATDRARHRRRPRYHRGRGERQRGRARADRDARTGRAVRRRTAGRPVGGRWVLRERPATGGMIKNISIEWPVVLLCI